MLMGFDLRSSSAAVSCVTSGRKSEIDQSAHLEPLVFHLNRSKLRRTVGPRTKKTTPTTAVAVAGGTRKQTTMTSASTSRLRDEDYASGDDGTTIVYGLRQADDMYSSMATTAITVIGSDMQQTIVLVSWRS